MRAFPIVLDAPLFDLAARVVERNEDVLVEAFLAQARIETLNVRVLDRLSRFDELQPYAVLVGPLVERPAAQLGTVENLFDETLPVLAAAMTRLDELRPSRLPRTGLQLQPHGMLPCAQSKPQYFARASHDGGSVIASRTLAMGCGTPG